MRQAKKIDVSSNGTNGNGHNPQDLTEALQVLKQHNPGAAAAAERALGREFAKEPADWGPQVRTLREAYTPRPRRVYIVEGLFKTPSLNIVYGPPGCLKTFLLIDLALDVAAGATWLEPMPDKPGKGKATIQTPVLWVDLDNGADEMDERVEALARQRNLPEDTPLYYISMPTPWLDASADTTPSYQAMREQALTHGAKLIVVDNLGVAAGNVEENSGDMARVLSTFRRLAEETGAAVVLVHHQRKQGGVKSRTGDTLRGHSSIEAALNLALLIEREEHSVDITVKATKVRGADVYPFGARFDFDWHPGTDILARARFYGVEIEDTTSDRAVENVLLEMVKELQPVNKTNMAKAAKEDLPDVGINRIRNAIDWLARDGRLAVHPGKKPGEKLYTLPDREIVSLDSLGCEE